MNTGVPSGTVAFLFTDVEGSTRLWADDSSAMTASLAVHDQVLRAAVAEHGGRVFSTAGDAFAAAFHTTTDALDAAVDAQLGLHAAEWPGPSISVRMGIHTGEADERDGDYFGPVLNKAARIMSAANGGQILLSSSAAELSSTWLSETTSLTDMGAHSLKDVHGAEHLFLAGHVDLPKVAKPIRTGRERHHNLTDYLTTFVGRSSELTTITDFLADHRLVTLSGVGGTGKTRLAVESAGRILGDFADGVWLVELAPVVDPANIMLTIGEVFDLRPGPGMSIDEVIAKQLADRQMLVIIDNCEHVLDGASAAIATLLSAGPGINVIATSRESLGITGEAIVRVPSLGLPEDADHVAEADAVHLFLDRAAEVRPGFEPTDADLAAISRICVRIDGIPLGLELAAARLRSLAPEDLADRLEESFRVLSGSAKTALPRQRTLNATIDWSHDLLTSAERAVFRRMALFLNGFDLMAAEAVCSCEEVDESEVLDRLDSLVDKSLLVPTHDPIVGTRYRMLEPVRQFAQEQLSASGEAADVRQAHADHFVRYVAMASPLTRQTGQMTWERRIDEDYDNIRAAFTALLEAGDIDPYLDMAFNLFSYWQHIGFHLDGIHITEQGIAAATAETDRVRLIKAYFTMSALGFEITLPRSVEDSAAGLDLANATGDLNLIGRMELAHGAAIRHATTRTDYGPHVMRGRDLLADHPEPYWWEEEWEHGWHDHLLSGYLPYGTQGIREHSERAIKTFEQLGDDAQLVAALCESAMQTGGDDDEWIRGNLERAIEMIEYVHVPYWAGHAHMFMGLLQEEHGEFDDAVVSLTNSIAPLEDSGDLSCWGVSLRSLAGIASRRGEHDAAAKRLLSVVSRAEGLPMKGAVERLVATGSFLMANSGRTDRAVVLLGWIDAHEPDLPSYVPQLDEAAKAAVLSEVGAEQDRLMAEGATQDLDGIVATLGGWLAE